MKYLKRFRLFEADDEVSADTVSAVKPDDKLENDNKTANLEVLKEIQKNLAEYKQKKSTIDAVFRDDEADDLKIQSELEKKVYGNERDVKKRNKYLSNYESLCRLKRVVDKIYDSISRDRSKVSEINLQISDLTERLNDVSGEKQKENINQQITKSKEFLKKVETNITDNQRKLALSEKNYNDKKNDFDKQMKIEEERIQKLSTQI
jgi:hypothetical protein